MTILKSLIRTYFLQSAIDVLLQKLMLGFLVPDFHVCTGQRYSSIRIKPNCPRWLVSSKVYRNCTIIYVYDDDPDDVGIYFHHNDTGVGYVMIGIGHLDFFL